MTESPPPDTSANVSHRLLSLDALRGFDMFWIIGGGPFVRAFKSFGDGAVAKTLATQMEHVAWKGFQFYDLIFPLFVFISGVSLVFSVSRQLLTSTKWQVTRTIVTRALILFLLGVLANGGVAKGMEGVRWMGVLQRIAIAYMGAGVLFVRLKPRALVGVCCGILLTYWALLTWVPVPDVGAGIYAEGQNLTNYIDRMYLPGRKHDGQHDPEGILSSLPAIASCLMGVFAGLWLRTSSTQTRKAAGLAIAGVILIGVGWLWGMQFPIIKKLWTSSFVLYAAGWSSLLLALFYYVIEMRGWRKGFAPFVWIGMNPITVFLMANVVSFPTLAQRFAGADVKDWLNTAIHPGTGELLLALISAGFGVLIAGFLYRRKIFLRV